MMQHFYKYLDLLPLENKSHIEGYSEVELLKIEKLYDIKIQGEFRDFMLKLGRCDGGLIGDDPIILYRDFWSVRGQVLFQLDLYEGLQNIKAYDLLKNKPFIFAWESETVMVFILTYSDNNAIY
ncbi:hypothetical protein [Acinetobacter sp. c1-l78]|uniref:hypothetical protein n=1 Tax=Acinetobacter sp. c1-l78 TaxID=3342803 RepID=UPI0035B6ED07